MYKMMSKAKNDDVEKKKSIKTQKLFGIELDEGAFGFDVTNMLIHRDCKSNIFNKSCFDEKLKQ